MQSIMWFGIYCKLIEILENVVRLLMSFFITFLKKRLRGRVVKAVPC